MTTEVNVLTSKPKPVLPCNTISVQKASCKANWARKLTVVTVSSNLRFPWWYSAPYLFGVWIQHVNSSQVSSPLSLRKITALTLTTTTVVCHLCCSFILIVIVYRMQVIHLIHTHTCTHTLKTHTNTKLNIACQVFHEPSWIMIPCVSGHCTCIKKKQKKQKNK